MPTQIKDVDMMLFMSSWYDLDWQGKFKPELGVSVTDLQKLHGFQHQGYAVSTGNRKLIYVHIDTLNTLTRHGIYLHE